MMKESVIQMTGPLSMVQSTGVPRAVVNGPLAAAAVNTDATMHQLKTAVHHELIKRMDLDKLAATQNDPAARLKLLATISQLVGEQNIPLSAMDREVIAKEVL